MCNNMCEVVITCTDVGFPGFSELRPKDIKDRFDTFYLISALWNAVSECSAFIINIATTHGRRNVTSGILTSINTSMAIVVYVQ